MAISDNVWSTCQTAFSQGGSTGKCSSMFEGSAAAPVAKSAGRSESGGSSLASARARRARWGRAVLAIVSPDWNGTGRAVDWHQEQLRENAARTEPQPVQRARPRPRS